MKFDQLKRCAWRILVMALATFLPPVAHAQTIQPTTGEPAIVSWMLYQGIAPVTSALYADSAACVAAANNIVVAAPTDYTCQAKTTTSVAVRVLPPPPPPPPVGPDGYTLCALENAVCKINAPGSVVYGANKVFTSDMQFKVDTPCTNAVFTDPLQGVAKACFFKAAPAPTPVPAPLPTAGYVKCADEDGVCALTMPAQVIYGAGVVFTAPKTFNADTPCTNNVFTDPIVGTVKACWSRVLPVNNPTPVATVKAWVRAAPIWAARSPLQADVGLPVRLGDGNHWVYSTMVAGMTCDSPPFGHSDSDPVMSAMHYTKWCDVQMTAPAVTQIPGMGPVVNPGLMPKPAFAYTGPRVRTLSAGELTLGVFTPDEGRDIGAFRVPVPYSHMSNNDPIVFPNQPGASHLHTFAGNACADATTITIESLMVCGKSTSEGGTLNQTAYWFPTMIDTRTGQPLVPEGTNFYYKSGYLGVDPTKVVPFPLGLRMIAGFPTAKTRTDGQFQVRFTCIGGPNNVNIPYSAEIGPCEVGATLDASVVFPQCWDGKNLDSPDHKSHMAYGTGAGCPADHPVPLPEVTLNIGYYVYEAGIEKFWKLSSDHYDGTGGHSMHADWFGAWDPDTIHTWVTNLLNKHRDGHDSLLGDGRILY